MGFLIAAAAMKPPQEPWTSTEQLLREAQDVRTAFAALDAVDAKERVDSIDDRLLRLEVELATGRQQDVARRVATWLAPPPAGNGTNGAAGIGTAAPLPMTEAQRDRMRVLGAAAQLALGRADLARKLLEERTTDAVDSQLLDLELRVARTLATADVAGAVDMFARIVRRTPPEDAAFRARVVEWLALRLRHDPNARGDVQREAERHRKLFEQQDCPADLREQWRQLGGA
jgi:hypothetical protein